MEAEGNESVRHIYLLFKNESHGERDSLEKQQHAENAEELQERRWRTEAEPREVFEQQPGLKRMFCHEDFPVNESCFIPF